MDQQSGLCPTCPEEVGAQSHGQVWVRVGWNPALKYCVCSSSSVTSVSFNSYLYKGRASQVAIVVKNPPANAGDSREAGSIPGLGRSPGVGNGNPLQYSCLENSTDRGAWWDMVHGLVKSQAWLSTHSTHKTTTYLFHLNQSSAIPPLPSPYPPAHP